MFDEFFIKRTLKAKFLKEHNLPKYSPESGIYLRWEIKVIQNGPYDPETGKALGEFEVIVKQKPSVQEMIRDRRVYEYDIKNKKLKYSDDYVWTF